MSRWTEKFSYWTGMLLNEDSGAYLLGRDDLMEKKTPHTVLTTLDHGEWTATSFPWSAIAVCCAEDPVREWVLVGHGGEMAAGPPGDLTPIPPIDVDRDEGKFGPLRCARTIAGRVHVGGMDRQVYRRTRDGWEALDEGLPGDDSEVVSIEALDGFDADEIYGVGRKGEIWRFDGKRWHAVPSPTRVILLGVHCAQDGFVYACGQMGTVLRGRGDAWKSIEQQATQEDLRDIVEFNGTIFLATSDVLYAMKDGVTEQVDFGEEDIPLSFHRFARAAGQLQTIGSKDVMRFDGSNWSRVD